MTFLRVHKKSAILIAVLVAACAPPPETVIASGVLYDGGDGSSFSLLSSLDPQSNQVVESRLVPNPSAGLTRERLRGLSGKAVEVEGVRKTVPLRAVNTNCGQTKVGCEYEVEALVLTEVRILE